MLINYALIAVLVAVTILDGGQPRHTPFLGQGRRVGPTVSGTSH